MKPKDVSGARIRDIQPGDFLAIRRVAGETWADTYRGIVPEGVQAEFMRRAYSEESLARRMDEGVFLVADLNEEVVGFADFYSDSGEARLGAIYVLPNEQGRGAGTRLLEAGASRFPADMRITLRVERDNLSARRFYEAHGFRETGEFTEDFSATNCARSRWCASHRTPRANERSTERASCDASRRMIAFASWATRWHRFHAGTRVRRPYPAHSTGAISRSKTMPEARSPFQRSGSRTSPDPMLRREELRGRVALVTGVGRHRGIGSAICRALAARGADIVLSYWKAYDREMPWTTDEEEPETLVEELRATGVRAEAIEVDLSLPESPERLLDTAEDRLGRPSILVNTAAHSERDGYEALDAETLDAHYAVNLRAMALLSVLFARRFEPGSGGRIINFTSGQSLGPMAGELAYAASKGAIEAFTRTLAAEVGYKGITVNAVNPGPTDTGWMSEDVKREILPKFPSGRLGQPEDAAKLVAFLASDEAAWITGQIINSEGGFLRE